MTSKAETILEVNDLKVHFPIRRGVLALTVGYVKAVDGVSFALKRGETLGIVGESGSGKSTLVRALTGLEKPTGGAFRLSARAGMVFQDPLGALNPRQTVRDLLAEAVVHSNRAAGRENAAQAESPLSLLQAVGLDESALDRYPHEFSGGQRQRICIARSLAAKPELLVLDEAVSALDLSIRAAILDLLSALKARYHLSYLFITHDLGVVSHFAERLIVMQKGRIVEAGPTREILHNPKTPYVKTLIGSSLSIPG